MTRESRPFPLGGEETQYRFHTLMMVHRNFQMFEFPPWYTKTKGQKVFLVFFKVKWIIRFVFFQKSLSEITLLPLERARIQISEIFYFGKSLSQLLSSTALQFLQYISTLLGKLKQKNL